MYLTQDIIRDDFGTMVREMKIAQMLQMNPELICQPAKISKRLQFTPSLTYPLADGVRVRLVEAKKDGHRNYWFNLIGNTYRLHPNSYSIEGMGMVDSWSGCHTMNRDNNGLVFEVISLPIDTMKKGSY